MKLNIAAAAIAYLAILGLCAKVLERGKTIETLRSRIVVLEAKVDSLHSKLP